MHTYTHAHTYIGDNVGAAGIIPVNGKSVHQLKCKLHGHCYNNQAEQTAILKVMDKLEELRLDKIMINALQYTRQQDNSGFTAKHI